MAGMGTTSQHAAIAEWYTGHHLPTHERGWAMLAVATCVLASLVTVAAPRGDGAVWPQSVTWTAVARELAETNGSPAAEEYLARCREWELGSINRALAIVLGQVLTVEPATAPFSDWPQGVPVWLITVEIKECVKGDCEGQTVTAQMGRLAGEQPPAVGKTYVFLLEPRRGDPAALIGGFASMRYEVDGEFVPFKGVPLAEFLDAIRWHLASRTPAALFRAADCVIIGTVTDYMGTCRDSLSALDVPGGRNFVELKIEQTAKGDIEPGSTIRVELPFTLASAWWDGSPLDVPTFFFGERVLLFIERADGGSWRLAGGADSRLPVRHDGSFGEYASLADLAAISTEPAE